MARNPRVVIPALLALVLVLAALVLQHLGDNNPPPAASPPPAIEGAGTGQQQSPTATRPRPDRDAAMFSALKELMSGASDSNCVRVISDAADIVLANSGAANRKKPSEEWLFAELNNLQRDLALESDPEAYLAAFLMDRPVARTSNDSPALQRFADLGTRAANSGSPLLAWHALRACADAKQACPFAELESRLLEPQQANGEAWVLAATIRYELGDTAGALSAMQRAARATAWTWHFPETIELIERSLAARTAIAYPDRLSAAFGFVAASGLPSQSELLKMCRTESPSSRAWGEACLALGTMRAKHPHTEFAGSIANSIRADALKALGDMEGAAQAKAEGQLYGAAHQAGGMELTGAKYTLFGALIESDPARLRDYLAAVRQFGEREAVHRFLRQELSPLMERTDAPERDQQCAALLVDARPNGGARFATTEDPIKAGDELHISVNGARGGFSTIRRVGADGIFKMPRAQPAGIAAAGKTSEQLQRDIALALPGSDRLEVTVIAVSAPSSQELRLEFDQARSEAAGRGKVSDD